MPQQFTGPFKLGGLNNKPSSSSSSSSMAVGLGILVHVSSPSHVHGDGASNNSNTVLRLRVLSQPMNPSRSQSPLLDQNSCYLKSCFLCNKNLSPDQDIYMYRGDQGFCSVECRNRQIALDDTKELELSTKKMVAAYRRCSGMSETGVLLDDLRRRNKHIPTHKARAIFS